VRQPGARQTTLEELQAGYHHADLITIRGKLLDRTAPHADAPAPGAFPAQVILTLQSSNFMFTAEGPATGDNSGLAALPLGSTLELTGICMLRIKQGGTLESGDVGTMESLQLLLPSVGGVRLLKKPSWLTPGRLLLGLALLSVVLLLAISWIVTVSRKNVSLKTLVGDKMKAQEELQKAHDLLDERVRERTAQLKFEMDARKEAEIRFKATLAERTRLAQELHDTLEQSLTGIGLQLDTAAKLTEQRAIGANRPLEMARNLMSRSQLELRRSIWDLRSRELEQFDFPDALQASAREILEEAQVGMDFAILGEPRRLSEIVEENLLRIGREAITNVVKHAGATTVTLRLDYSRNGMAIRIVDDGRGFSPEHCPGSSEGHFGLTGMRERAKRIGGELRLHSGPGKGTTIEVYIPIPPVDPTVADMDAQGMI